MRIKYFALIPAAASLSLLSAAAVKTALMPKRISVYAPDTDENRAADYAEKLSEMVKCETVSSPDDNRISKFCEFHELLCRLFPNVHEKLERTVIDGNLLYFWRGVRHDKPLVLMSHQDVVPAEGEWEHAPFSGDITDGKVWGRGAADTKCTLMAFFQAVEELCSVGYIPEQDVYLASSCTEEINGDGCPKIVAELKRRGVKPHLVCDEGGGIISEPIGGVKGNYAMIGVFEKGKGDLKFTARSTGGHSAAPKRNSPIARLAAFENAVEKRSPFKKKLPPEVREMFESLAPYAGFGMRLLFGNLWLFEPLLKAVLPMLSAQAGAMLKTTIAFTMQSGSEAVNVIPQEASVWANMRFIPHQGKDESIKIITRLAAKYGLETEVIRATDHTKPVSTKGEAWDKVIKAIEKTFPGLAYSPYIMTGATDSSFFSEICENCVRFGPVVFGPEQMKGMHGLNENIEIKCLPGAVDFYKNIIDLNK